MAMTWSERYKAMKKGMGWTNRDVADRTGNTVGSIASATRPGGQFPNNLKLSVVVYESFYEKYTTDETPRHMFVGKVVDEIGLKKTYDLLKESNDVFFRKPDK